MPELGRKRKRPGPESPDQLEKRRVSQALMKMSERSLTVDPRTVDAYQPREIDVQIAEAMLAGAITFKAIAEALDVAPATISTYMKNPMVCAWVSRAVHSNVSHRLGMVDAAMLNRAMAGDTRAAKLIYDRYHQMVQRSVRVSIQGGMDFAKLDDKDLDALINDAAQSGKVIDVEVTEEQTDDGPAD